MDYQNCDQNESEIKSKHKLPHQLNARFLRIKPLDHLSIRESPYKVIDSDLLFLDLGENYKLGKEERTRIYKFDGLFDDDVKQESVYSECCSPLVNDVLNGINALLFSFGTTSSGRSYTMRGPMEDPITDPGLIPLSLKHIFSSRKFIDNPLIGKSKFCDISLLDEEQQLIATQFKDSILSSNCCRNVSNFSTIDNKVHSNDDGFQYICNLSYVEIRDDLIYDLLVPCSSGGRATALSLSQDNKKRYYVKDLKSVMVSSLSEALKIYSFGWTNLQKNMKEMKSSQSHSFVCISLIKFKEKNGKLLESQVSHLTLGDLDGSEKENKTHSGGATLNEQGNINTYSDQLRLSQKKNFVKMFRASSLIKFMTSYLTDNGKVWMIVNINPSPTLLPETCRLLDFSEVLLFKSPSFTPNKLTKADKYNKLAICNAKNQKTISNMKFRIDQLRNELFDAREAIVRLNEGKINQLGDREIQTEDQFVHINQYEKHKESKKKTNDTQSEAVRISKDNELHELRVELEETKSKLAQLRQESAQRLFVTTITTDKETQTDKEITPKDGDVMIVKDLHTQEMKKLRETIEKVAEEKLELLRQRNNEKLKRLQVVLALCFDVITKDEVRTKTDEISSQESEATRENQSSKLKRKLEDIKVKVKVPRMGNKTLEQLRETLTNFLEVSIDEDGETETKDIPIQESEIILETFGQGVNHQSKENNQPQFVVETDDPVFAVPSKRPRKTLGSNCLQEITNSTFHNSKPRSLISDLEIHEEDQFDTIKESTKIRRSFRCKFCRKSFSTVQALSSHSKYHENRSQYSNEPLEPNVDIDLNNIPPNFLLVRMCTICRWIEKAKATNYNTHFRGYHSKLVKGKKQIVSQFREMFMDKTKYESLKCDWYTNFVKNKRK